MGELIEVDGASPASWIVRKSDGLIDYSVGFDSTASAAIAFWRVLSSLWLSTSRAFSSLLVLVSLPVVFPFRSAPPLSLSTP